MKFNKGLDLLADENTKILIVDSFPRKLPDDKVLNANREYYLDKKDKFWKIIDKVYSQDFSSISYSMKTNELLSRGVGLWSIYSDVQRDSLDTDDDFPGFSLNNFSELKDKCPNLEKICFNGKFKGLFKIPVDYSKNFSELGYDVVVLPRSLGNNKTQKERVKIWSKELI